MKKKVLVFPSTEKMAEFIIAYRKYNVIVNFPEFSITGIWTPQEISKACTEYGARIHGNG